MEKEAQNIIFAIGAVFLTVLLVLLLNRFFQIDIMAMIKNTISHRRLNM